MDCNKVGKLILSLRKEKQLTQLQLAEVINVSDKAISKWERGLGCPDVSLLPELSAALGVNIEKLLSGELDPNSADRGNLKRLRFYVCPVCGNILTSTGDAELSCCGRRLHPLAAKPADDEHRLHTEQIEDDCYITFSHEMSKSHYLSFIACVSGDKALLVRLYPEQGGDVRFPMIYGSRLYFYCSRHGLWLNR